MCVTYQVPPETVMNGKSKLAGERNQKPKHAQPPKWDYEEEACGEVCALRETKHFAVDQGPTLISKWKDKLSIKWRGVKAHWDPLEPLRSLTYFPGHNDLRIMAPALLPPSKSHKVLPSASSYIELCREGDSGKRISQFN